MTLLHDLFSFHGRLGRDGYFGGLMLLLALLTVSLINAGLIFVYGPPAIAILVLLGALAVSLWIWLAVTAKRFHDVGQPWNRSLVVLIPIIGWHFAKELVTAQGEEGANRYGPDPEPRPGRAGG